MATSNSTYPSQTPATPSRPLGVAILAFLIGLYGFLVILLGALLLVGSSLGIVGGGLPHSFGVTGTLAGVIVLVIGLIILGLAVGLWHLRMWALVLTLLFLAFEMVSYGLAGDFVSLGFILALVLFVYLLAVSRHF